MRGAYGEEELRASRSIRQKGIGVMSGGGVRSRYRSDSRETRLWKTNVFVG